VDFDTLGGKRLVGVVCVSDDGSEDNAMVISNRADIKIDRRRVLRGIGYSAGSKPSARVSYLTDEHIEKAYQLIEPAYSYIIRDVERVRRSCVFVEGSIMFESVVIARLLEQCQKVAVFLATIGNRLEKRALRLAEDGLVLQSAVLDAIGSVAADKVAEAVQDRIREMARADGLCVSQRFSPGYCDWSIREQKMLFRAMDGASMGVRLTRECLMVPRKSISGIIGIGACGNGVENYNPCRTCRKRDCPGRR